MTQEEFNAKWADLLAGKKTPADVAADEHGGETLPPPPANPTISGTWDMDEFRNQAIRRLLKREV